jgi:hypothetical protein
MNGTIHSAAPGQTGVGRVYDGIDLLVSNVTQQQLDLAVTERQLH